MFDVNPSILGDGIPVFASNDFELSLELVDVEKVIIKKGGDEVETWIHLQLNQAHQMGYGTERRDCRFTKRWKINAF
jgi:hypothetical protein